MLNFLLFCISIRNAATGKWHLISGEETLFDFPDALLEEEDAMEKVKERAIKDASKKMSIRETLLMAHGERYEEILIVKQRILDCTRHERDHRGIPYMTCFIEEKFGFSDEEIMNLIQEKVKDLKEGKLGVIRIVKFYASDEDRARCYDLGGRISRMGLGRTRSPNDPLFLSISNM